MGLQPPTAGTATRALPFHLTPEPNCSRASFSWLRSGSLKLMPEIAALGEGAPDELALTLAGVTGVDQSHLESRGGPTPTATPSALNRTTHPSDGGVCR